MKIQSLNSYYFHDGKFYSKNKWVKPLKYAIAVLFVIGSFFVINETSSYMSPHIVTQSETDTKIISYLTQKNPKLEIEDAKDIINSTFKWAKEFNVDPFLLFAIQEVETKYNKHGISPTGALGLMQVIPSWHLAKISKAIKDTGSPEVFDINTNIYLGTWILRDCAVKFSSKKNSLLCYNGSVTNPNGYDQKVMVAYSQIKNQIRME